MLSSTAVEAAKKEVNHVLSQTSESDATRRIPINKKLFDDDKMRRAVAEEFGEVCAYCETATSESVTGGVTHHRPPSLAQDEGGNTQLTAYAWLMYEWENLLWVCSDCQRAKQNKFYVRGRRGVIGSTVEEVRLIERELMMDPCLHRASEHLSFDRGGHVTEKSLTGWNTIAVLDLNRETLVESRKKAILELIEAVTTSKAWLSTSSSRSTTDRTQKVLVWNRYKKSQPHSAAATLFILSVADRVNMGVRDAYEFLQTLNDNWRAAIRQELKETAIDHQPHDRHASMHEDTTRLSRQIGSYEKRMKPWPSSRYLRKPPPLDPISRINIKNYKALRDTTFELPTRPTETDQTPCIILLGENGTGKSSVLEALALAIIGTSQAETLDNVLTDEVLAPVELAHRPDTSLWSKPAKKIEINLQFGKREAAQIFAAAEDMTFSGTTDCSKVVLGYGPRRFFTNHKRRRFRAPAHRVRSLFDPLDTVANPILWLRKLDREQFFAAARALREILMLDNEDDFERDEGEKGEIFIRQHGQRIALKDLSVGYKSVIAMSCDIIRELLTYYDNLEHAHAVVLIDELETHLHPRWKLRIMSLLRKAFPKVQLIVTTHDPLCLRGMNDGEVFVLQRNAETKQIEALNDLPSIRGMRAEQILTSEFFGLGSTDPETDARLVRYNRLAVRHDSLNESERIEMDQLKEQLNDSLTMGSTFFEQAYAEALKDQIEENTGLNDATAEKRKRLKRRFSNFLTKSAST